MAVGAPLKNPAARRNVCPQGTHGSAGAYVDIPEWAGLCTLDGIMTFAEWIMWLALIITGLALVMAGVIFMTSAGNAERLGKAKKIFYWSFLGILIAVGAKFLPAIARYFIGV